LGVIFGLLAVVLICLLVFFVVCSRRRSSRTSFPRFLPPWILDGGDKGRKSCGSGSKKRVSRVNSGGGGCCSRPVLRSKFLDYCDEMAKDSNLEYSSQYEDLRLVGKDQSTEASEMECNRLKIRYVNIKPYDVTRVKLLPIGDTMDDGSDYINASWMPGFHSRREFIAAQGPLPATVDDFWRMVWEYNCRAVVMLTRCVENGKIKCDHYWPVDAEPVVYGDLQVAVVKETTNDEVWTVRDINVNMG
jgi:protein tyrosine phosphatase